MYTLLCDHRFSFYAITFLITLSVGVKFLSQLSHFDNKCPFSDSGVKHIQKTKNYFKNEVLKLINKTKC